MSGRAPLNALSPWQKCLPLSLTSLYPWWIAEEECFTTCSMHEEKLGPWQDSSHLWFRRPTPYSVCHRALADPASEQVYHPSIPNLYSIHMVDPGRTRNCNRLMPRHLPTPYPLGHKVTHVSISKLYSAHTSQPTLHMSPTMTLAVLEHAFFGSEDQRLTH